MVHDYGKPHGFCHEYWNFRNPYPWVLELLKPIKPTKPTVFCDEFLGDFKALWTVRALYIGPAPALRASTCVPPARLRTFPDFEKIICGCNGGNNIANCQIACHALFLTAANFTPMQALRAYPSPWAIWPCRSYRTIVWCNIVWPCIIPHNFVVSHSMAAYHTEQQCSVTL